jgi:hypothetical protein
MTADAAHVAAVAEVISRTWVMLDGRTVRQISARAVETLTPLIRARVAVEIRAEAAQVLTDDAAGQIERSALDTAARIAEGGTP